MAFNPPLANDKGKVGIDEVVANVPDVGKVTLVAPVNVRVAAYAPLVVKLPPSVTVDEPLLIPVPPYVGEIIVPPQTRRASITKQAGGVSQFGLFESLTRHN